MVEVAVRDGDVHVWGAHVPENVADVNTIAARLGDGQPVEHDVARTEERNAVAAYDRDDVMKSARQQKQRAAGYRNERTPMDCFATPLLKRSKQPISVLEQILGRRGFSDFRHADLLNACTNLRCCNRLATSELWHRHSLSP